MSVSLTYAQNVTLDICEYGLLSYVTSWQNMKAQQGLHCSTNQKHIHTEHNIKTFDWTQMSALGFILWVLLCCQTLYHCPPTSVWTQTAVFLRQKQVSTCPPDTHRSGKVTSIKTVILSDMLMWERFREVQNHNGNIYLRNSFIILQDFYTGNIRLSWSNQKLTELNTCLNVILWALLGASWSNRSK